MTQELTSFDPQPVSSILARKPQPIEWLWDRYIATGDLFVFAAYMKVGKSTFFYPLIIAIARGTAFLGFETKQSGVLILALEEHPRDVELRLRKLGVREDDNIFIHGGPLPSNSHELSAIRDFVKQNHIGLVMIDSLPYWWNIRNENDNAEILEKTKPLLELARKTDAAIGLVHHESKYGGRSDSGENKGDGKSIRGGSALFGIIDQALLLDRRHGGSSNQRVLKAIGRHAESPQELFIKLVGNPGLSDPSGYEYSVEGTGEECTKAGYTEKVLGVLSGEFVEVTEIAEKANLGSKMTRIILEDLVNDATDSTVERTGKGVKGDPHKYRLKLSPEPTQDSFPDSFPGYN